jgi:hypothetical protein
MVIAPRSVKFAPGLATALNVVVPAQAETQPSADSGMDEWIPACAGMTILGCEQKAIPDPTCARKRQPLSALLRLRQWWASG